MSPWQCWWTAIRPRTLGLSAGPVILGTVWAWLQTGRWAADVFMVTLFAALCIQIGTNLHNDAADFRTGTDGQDRLGPPRVSAQGWLSPTAVERAALLAFGLALLAGVYLVWVGGWPILLTGVLALLAGAAYSGGPVPISATPLGELFVFLFFGVVAVAGSYYLQAGQLDATALWLGAALGCVAAAVLVVNNYRDRRSDARSGRKTLAVLLPRRASQLEYALLLLTALWLVGWVESQAGWPWVTALMSVWAAGLVWLMFSLPVGRALNSLLAHTARFGVVLTLALSTRLWFSH